MDRLPTLIALLLLCSGCDEPGGGEPPPSRVIAVGASAQGPDRAAFCEVRSRRPLSLPELAGPTPTRASGWRWINVWATWCRPCVEELPMIASWQRRLSEAGVDVELVLLSADADAGAVDAFIAAHPEARGSLRAADPDALPAWIAASGLDEGAPLPVHLFLDPAGAVRCARAGALQPHDYDDVAALLSD